MEHIENPCMLTIACNPKEYYEMFEDRDVNKKGLKKDLAAWDLKILQIG